MPTAVGLASSGVIYWLYDVADKVVLSGVSAAARYTDLDNTPPICVSPCGGKFQKNKTARAITPKGKHIQRDRPWLGGFLQQ